ncbi:12809_t:CDS:2, partial [Acaulospora colombiana]
MTPSTLGLPYGQLTYFSEFQTAVLLLSKRSEFITRFLYYVKDVIQYFLAQHPQPAGNPQLARNILTLARNQLQQTIRRTPHGITTPEPYQSVHRLFIVVVELLMMEETPDRQIQSRKRIPLSQGPGRTRRGKVPSRDVMRGEHDAYDD